MVTHWRFQLKEEHQSKNTEGESRKFNNFSHKEAAVALL